MAEIKITSSKGNSTKGHTVFWAHVDGVMLRKSNGVGRTFRSEAGARKAAKKASATRCVPLERNPFYDNVQWRHDAA